MKKLRHGLSVGMERVDEHFFLSLKVVGTLTHEDYLTITPLIDSALEGVKDPEIKALIDGVDFDGWEMRAAWDDFKLGLKHGNEFSRIAIYGNKKWQEYMPKVARWFMSGEMKFFDNVDEAISWLNAD